MTKEEAIKALRGLSAVEYYREVIQMAIEALSGEPCEDAVSRRDAVEALEKWESESVWDEWLYEHRHEPGCEPPSLIVKQLPSAQPEIIRCRNCKFASGDSRICMKFGHSPIGELDFCAWAERRTDE